jgi:hypothetical protein
LSEREATTATPHPKLRVAMASPPPAALLERLAELFNDSDRGSEFDARALLREFVPEFQPNHQASRTASPELMSGSSSATSPAALKGAVG